MDLLDPVRSGGSKFEFVRFVNEFENFFSDGVVMRKPLSVSGNEPIVDKLLSFFTN